jgi:hypothetical protein
MEQCLEHQSVKSACADIPELVKTVHELVCALNGEVGKPGWMTQQELRMAAMERQVSVIMRVMWGLGSVIGLTVLGMILRSAGIV